MIQTSKIKVYENAEQKYFKAIELAKLLGYKNTNQAIIEHVDNIDKLYGRDFPGKKLHPQTILINQRGVKSLVCKSRLPNANIIAKELGIDLLGQKVTSKEADTIGNILIAFQGENMVQQYIVGKYRTDLYFPIYNIAVECDENGHADRNPVDERIRQDYITNNLKCSWYRFNPDDKAFNMFQVINGIYHLINAAKEKK